MYRILTEDKNREQVYAILDKHVDGYTVSTATGAWKGTRENSLVIDLVGVDLVTATAIALAIKATNEQESVLILEIDASPLFV